MAVLDALGDLEPVGSISASRTELVGRVAAVPPRLSVVVPTYRDGPRIVESIDRLTAALAETGLPWEVIIVVDGDASTFDHARACARKGVEVWGYKDNRGKGFALRYGISLARGELVTFIDSDMEIGPEEIGRMVRLLDLYEADIVVGSKRHPLSLVHYPLLRRFQSWCYQGLVHALFRVRVRDTQTGLKVMRREVAQRTLDVAVVRRFAFDLELLALAHHFGFRRIIEAPVTIHYQFRSTTNLRAAASVLWDTLRIFYRLRIRRAYHLDHTRGLVALRQALPPLMIHDEP
jgi:glycosyltransferase involved in cell wall biosynthesis